MGWMKVKSQRVVWAWQCWTCDGICPHLVVELALVLVAVSVYGAEEAATSAGEPSQPHLLLAHAAPILLLLPILTSVLLPRGSGDRGTAGPPGLGCLLDLGLWLRSEAGNCGLGCLKTRGCRGWGSLLLGTHTRAGRGGCNENVIRTYSIWLKANARRVWSKKWLWRFSFGTNLMWIKNKK